MNELQTIHEFLLELESEVGGNASTPVGKADGAALRDLAAGRANDETKARLEALLAGNSEAMEYLAGLLGRDGEHEPTA